MVVVTKRGVVEISAHAPNMIPKLGNYEISYILWNGQEHWNSDF